MVDCLFAYGTLLAPELLYSVVGRRIKGQPAVLQGYICRRVRRAAYPAITKLDGATTHGSMYCGIDDLAWRRLDDFESNLYERRLIELTQANGSPAMAYTYVIADTYKDRLTDEAWEFERFRRLHLGRYLNRLPK